WKDTLTVNPHSWLANDQLGELYVNQRRFPEAIDHFSKLVQFYPERSFGYINLGNALLSAGKTQEAADMLNRALAMPATPADERARANESLGTLYGQQGQFDKAEEFFAKAHTLNPESFSINFYLGKTYFNENKLDLARMPLEQAAQTMPEDVRSRVLLAIIA